MSTISKLPLVTNESEFSKNNKMLFTITVIILIMLYIYYQQEYEFCIEEPSKRYIEHLTDRKLDFNKPIIGQYIQIINNSKKIIPVYKIVIIDKNKNIIPIYTKNATKQDFGKNGVLLEYKLNKPSYISQIILDVNMLDIRSKNIINSQVKIVDKDRKTIWENNSILHLSQNIEINIDNYSYIYPIMQEKMDFRNSDNEQEVVLKNKLIENNWV